MIKNKILLLGVCIAVASCASLKKYSPVSEVSDSLYGNIAQSPESQNIANVKWQDFFSDTKLCNLIEAALSNSLDLRVAQEHITQAEAMLTSAKLAYIPTLGINPSFAITGRDGNTTYQYSVAASSSWQLNIFRMINDQVAAKSNVELMNDYYQAVKSKLVASVANAYYTILMLDSQLATAVEMEETWVKSVNTVRALKKAGMTDQVAVSQYEANLDNIRITLRNLRNQLVQAENAMCLLMSSEPGMKIERATLEEQTLSTEIALGVPVQMLTLRPDVRSSQREIEQAYYTTRGAILNFFPSLSLNGSVGLVNPLTGELSPMNLLSSIGSSLVAPILTGGKNKAALEAAKSRQREASLSFDKVLLTAGNEVNNAYNNYNTCLAMEENYINRVKALDKARIDTEYLMKNSLDKTYLDVLYAYTNFFDAKLGAISNSAKKMQAVVTLYEALGGGAL